MAGSQPVHVSQTGRHMLATAVILPLLMWVLLSNADIGSLWRRRPTRKRPARDVDRRAQQKRNALTLGVRRKTGRLFLE